MSTRILLNKKGFKSSELRLHDDHLDVEAVDPTGKLTEKALAMAKTLDKTPIRDALWVHEILGEILSSAQAASLIETGDLSITVDENY